MTFAWKLALAPVLLAQGAWARVALPRLPEPAGARSGVVGRGEQGPVLLIVGDSSAAGVGVSTQDEALAGRLPRDLAHRLRMQVRWQLCARSGLTTAQAPELLHDAGPADVAVVVTGVNDVIDQVPTARAQAAREALLAELQAHCGVRHVVWTPVPPMDHFSALPQPLRWLLGQDAAAHELALHHWARLRGDCSHLPFALPLNDPTLLASDGFHPAAALYKLWAEALAEHIAKAVWPRL